MESWHDLNVFNVQKCQRIMITWAVIKPNHEFCLVPTCDCHPQRWIHCKCFEKRFRWPIPIYLICRSLSIILFLSKPIPNVGNGTLVYIIDSRYSCLRFACFNLSIALLRWASFRRGMMCKSTIYGRNRSSHRKQLIFKCLFCCM